MENLFSEIPSEFKEFVEKNDTTGGGFSSESFGSVGNQNFNQEEEEEKSESVEEISPLLPKTTAAPPPLLQKSSPVSLHKSITPLFQSVSATNSAKHEEKIEDFDQIGSSVIWGKNIENFGNIKDKERGPDLIQ